MQPIIIGISGPTGCGKSTIATELAHRLDIVRIISTDTVREVMRATLSKEVAPILHKSSFELETVEEFYEQARLVSVGLRGVLNRAVCENLSMIVEGVHLLPSEWDLTYHYLLNLEDADDHRGYLHTRSEETKGSRPVDRYLDHFLRIRDIQRSLIANTLSANCNLRVKIVENSDMSSTVNFIMDDISRSH